MRRDPIDGIVAVISAVSAPLPARPWTAPTISGRRASVHRPTGMDADVAPCTWECVGPTEVWPAESAIARKPNPTSSSTTAHARTSATIAGMSVRNTTKSVPATSSVNV